MDLSIFNTIIILLFAAVLVNITCRACKIPTIIGYIVIGMLLGPHLLGVISNRQDIRDLAEFGIVFLLFTIGLEFSLTKLMAMRSLVFGYGGLQVLITVLVTIPIAYYVGIDLNAAIILGAVVAMSSTAIVTRQLTEQLELLSPHGHNSLAILLFQDLAVIPFLILIPSLANAQSSSLTLILFWALVKGVIAIAAILFLGNKILRPLFQKISMRHSSELFTLTTLFIALAAAWITHALGLSLALGAFLAGIMLGETEFRHQIELEARPFRDVLLGLFFITIGMQFEFEQLPTNWLWVLLMLFALVVFKTSLISLLGLYFSKQKDTAARTGVILAQGGEFGFALLLLMLNHHLLPNSYGQVVLAALLISMLIAPFFIRYNRQIVAWCLPNASKDTHRQYQQDLAMVTQDLESHVILCGYGRMGAHVATFLRQEDIPFMALDLDPAKIQTARSQGVNIAYGDASHHDILSRIGLNQAKAIAICFDNPALAMKVLQQIRQLNQDIPIFVRSFDDSNIEELQQCGATEVIPETLESSIILAAHLLVHMGVSASKVFTDMERSRQNRYELLRQSQDDSEQ